jgi:hypothetical protein
MTYYGLYFYLKFSIVFPQKRTFKFGLKIYPLGVQSLHLVDQI